LFTYYWDRTLGLFIAKAIATAHGGGIEVDSEHDETTFRLVLPRHATASGSVAN
jgi:nitrogen-specific signal transduction histidine kinase